MGIRRLTDPKHRQNNEVSDRDPQLRGGCGHGLPLPDADADADANAGGDGLPPASAHLHLCAQVRGADREVGRPPRLRRAPRQSQDADLPWSNHRQGLRVLRPLGILQHPARRLPQETSLEEEEEDATLPQETSLEEQDATLPQETLLEEQDATLPQETSLEEEDATLN